MVRCCCSGLVGGLPYVACVALLACVGGLAIVMCACGGFLLYILLAHAFLTIASVCNTSYAVWFLLVTKRRNSRPTSVDQQRKNRSTQTMPQAASNHKNHPTRTGAAGTKQHTAPNSPECNRIKIMRLHPDTRERSNKSTAPTATYVVWCLYIDAGAGKNDSQVLQ